MLYRRYSLDNLPTMCGSKEAGGHILWLGEIIKSFLLRLLELCIGRAFLVHQTGFCFAGVALFPSVSLPLSSLFLFSLFLRNCLIHARMPDWDSALCMDVLSCIHGVGRRHW